MLIGIWISNRWQIVYDHTIHIIERNISLFDPYEYAT